MRRRLKDINVKLSGFVRMLVRRTRSRRHRAKPGRFVSPQVIIVQDIKQFILVLLIFATAFTHIFYLRLSTFTQSELKSSQYQRLDNGFSTVSRAAQTGYFFAFTSNFEEDNFPRNSDLFYLDIFIFCIDIVMLNVLSASKLRFEVLTRAFASQSPSFPTHTAKPSSVHP